MARTAKEYTAPKTMDLQGDGLEEVTVTRYLERAKKDENGNVLVGTYEKKGKTLTYPVDRPVTFKVRRPKDAAGLKAFQGAVNAVTPGEGNRPILTAISNHMIEAKFSAIKDADENGKDYSDLLKAETNLYPDFPAVRITDENEAMAEQVKAALVSGALKPEDIAALFGKLAQK